MKIKPITIVAITVIVSSGALVALNWYIRHYERKVDISVSYDGSPAKGITQSRQVLQKPDAMNPTGEMYQTAKRVREAGIILGQAVLFNATSRMQGRVPSTVAELIVPLPAGITQRAAGIWESEAGVYYLRYRVMPMAFEVLAQPKTPGPKLLLRLDPKAMDSDGLKFYEATRLGEIEVPPAFAAAPTFLGKGWSEQRLPTETFSAEDKQKLITWARAND